jgi:hypothetical protein
VTGMFHRQLPLPPTGDIPVAGPFTPDRGEKAKAAKVLFLIVQGNGPNAVTVEGEGRWIAGGANEWTGKVKRRGALPGGASASLTQGLARGIAMAIVVKPGRLTGGRRFDPPTIQALTWCSDFEFV